MKIKELIAGKRVSTISPSASAYDLVMSLEHHHIGALVVSRDGKKIDGIVSERDVVRAMPHRIHEITELTVSDLMSVDVVTCTSDASVEEIMQIMTENRFRHMPVVDDSGNLLSIISIGDLVKAYISDINAERTALRDYITKS